MLDDFIKILDMAMPEACNLSEKIVTKEQARKDREEKNKANKANKEASKKEDKEEKKETNQQATSTSLIPYNAEVLYDEEYAEDYSDTFKEYMNNLNTIISTFQKSVDEAMKKWQSAGADKPCPKDAYDIMKSAMDKVAEDYKTLREVDCTKMHSDEVLFVGQHMEALSSFLQKKSQLLESLHPEEFIDTTKGKNELTKTGTTEVATQTGTDVATTTGTSLATVDNNTALVTRNSQEPAIIDAEIVDDVRSKKNLITYDKWIKLNEICDKIWTALKEDIKKINQSDYPSFCMLSRLDCWVIDGVTNLIKQPLTQDIIKTLVNSNPITYILFSKKFITYDWATDKIKKVYQDEKNRLNGKKDELNKKKNKRGLIPKNDVRSLDVWQLKALYLGDKFFCNLVNLCYNYIDIDKEDKAKLLKYTTTLNNAFGVDSNIKSVKRTKEQIAKEKASVEKNRDTIIKTLEYLFDLLDKICVEQSWDTENDIKKAINDKMKNAGVTDEENAEIKKKSEEKEKEEVATTQQPQAETQQQTQPQQESLISYRKGLLKDLNFDSEIYAFMPSGLEAKIMKEGNDILVQYTDGYTDKYTKEQFMKLIEEGIIMYDKQTKKQVIERYGKNTVKKSINEEIDVLQATGKRESAVKSKRLKEAYNQEDCPEGTVYTAMQKEKIKYIPARVKNELINALKKISRENEDVHIRQQARSFIDDVSMQEYEHLAAIKKFAKENLAKFKPILEDAQSEKIALEVIAIGLQNGDKTGKEKKEFGNWLVTTSLDTKWEALTEKVQKFILAQIAEDILKTNKSENDIKLEFSAKDFSKEDLQSLDLFDEETIDALFVDTDLEADAELHYNLQYDKLLESLKRKARRVRFMNEKAKRNKRRCAKRVKRIKEDIYVKNEKGKEEGPFVNQEAKKEYIKQQKKQDKNKEFEEIIKESYTDSKAKKKVHEDCYKIYPSINTDEVIEFENWEDVDEYLRTEYDHYVTILAPVEGEPVPFDDFIQKFVLDVPECEDIDCDGICDSIECAPIEGENQDTIVQVSQPYTANDKEYETIVIDTPTDNVEDEVIRDIIDAIEPYATDDIVVEKEEDSDVIERDEDEENSDNSVNEEFKDGMLTDINDLDFPAALQKTVDVKEDGELYRLSDIKKEVDNLRDVLKSEIENIKNDLKLSLQDIKQDLKQELNNVDNKVQDTKNAVSNLTVEEENLENSVEEEIPEVEAPEEVEEETVEEVKEEPEEEEKLEESYNPCSTYSTIKKYLRTGKMEAIKYGMFEDVNSTKQKVDQMIAAGKSPDQIKSAIDFLANNEQEKDEVKNYAADKVADKQ